MHHGPGGAVLDVGRKTRTVPPSIRRALQARDRIADFRAAPPAAATRTTWSTGPTAVPPASTTCCCCAGIIIGRPRGRVHAHPARPRAGEIPAPNGDILEAAPAPPVALGHVGANVHDIPLDRAPFDVVYAIDVSTLRPLLASSWSGRRRHNPDDPASATGDRGPGPVASSRLAKRRTWHLSPARVSVRPRRLQPRCGRDGRGVSRPGFEAQS